MRRVTLALLILETWLAPAGCGPASPAPRTPATRPASRPAPRPTPPRLPRALRRPSVQQQLLSLVRARPRRGLVTVLVADWTRALQLERAVSDALRTAPWGKQLVAYVRREAAREQLLLPWSQQALRALGIDARQPALYSGHDGRRQMLFSFGLTDRSAFRRRLQQLARAQRWHYYCRLRAPTWRVRRAAGGQGEVGHLQCRDKAPPRPLRPSPGDGRDVLSCLFRRGRATCARREEDLLDALRLPAAQSLWAQLSPARRKLLQKAVALVQIDQEADALGGLIAVDGARVVLDGWLDGRPSRYLFGQPAGRRGKRALAGLARRAREVLYLHVTPRRARSLVSRTFRLGLGSFAVPWHAFSGEAALVTLPSSGEVALVLGTSSDADARRLHTIASRWLGSPSVKHAFLKKSTATTLGGRPAHRVELKRGYGSYPTNVPLGAAVLPRAVALGSWAALVELARPAPKPRGARDSRGPPRGALGFARLELGDPLPSRRLAGVAKALAALNAAGRLRELSALRALLSLLRGVRLELRDTATGAAFKGVLSGLQPLAKLGGSTHRSYLGALAARFGSGGAAAYRRLAHALTTRAPRSPQAAALAWAWRGQGLLAAAAGALAPVFAELAAKHKLRQLTVEATRNLDRLRTGARAYYRKAKAKRGAARAAFPAAMTHWTPARRCCKRPGGVCRPRRRDWRGKVWRQLGFALRKPHRYQYRVSSRGRGSSALLRAEARADLDCDGTYSNYWIEVFVDGRTGHVYMRGPVIANALE